MVLVSGLSHAVYFGSLGKAYEAGELSQFILALGSSVFLVPTLSVPDGANLRNGGRAIVLVLLGIFALHMKSGSWKNLGLPSRERNRCGRCSQGGNHLLFPGSTRSRWGSWNRSSITYLVFFMTAEFSTSLALMNSTKPIREIWRGHRQSVCSFWGF